LEIKTAAKFWGTRIKAVGGMADEGPAEVSRSADALPHAKTLLGIGHSRLVILKLAALFAVDSCGGGFVVQSFVASRKPPKNFSVKCSGRFAKERGLHRTAPSRAAGQTTE
jgi:hypothetical protein